MAPSSSRRRRRRSETYEEDDADSVRYGLPPNGTVNSPKRTRLDLDDEAADSIPSGQSSHGADLPRRTHLDRVMRQDEGDEGAEVEGEGDNSHDHDVSQDEDTDEDLQGTATPVENNPDGFQPGAIVRVSVKDFITYEKADFFPGPHLNMVIGPNGTGKSSLVCAICLGLGYAPKHLGRAGAVWEFVRHGKDLATIETELYKRPKDRHNLVVRMQIRREQNNQRFWVNNKETTQRDVRALMRKFKIQIDNLCQFLPQDRVVEFAASSPVALLDQTLQAAASREMIQWQQQLRALHTNKKTVVDARRNDAEILKNLETRQQGLQADVDRIHEREVIQENLESLRSALIVSQYQEAKENNQRARDRKKRTERALVRLREDTGPALQAVGHKEEYARLIEAAIPVRRQALHNAEEAAKRCAQDVNSATDTVKEWDDKLEAQIKSFDAKKKDLATSKAKLTSLQAELKNRPEEFTAADFNQRIRAEEHRKREIEGELRELGVRHSDLKDKGRAHSNRIKKVENDIESFDTQQGQQLNLMKRHFPEVASAWEWVSEHQNDFEKEVFGPPMISCSIKDERYSDQVQSLLQPDDFICFTAQTKSDWKKLTNQLYRVMSLSVVVRTCAHDLNTFKPPLSASEAEDHGLDGFAIDFLDGPAPILAMLCAEKRIHQSGVTLREHNDEQYDRLVHGAKVNQWAAGKQSFTIRRRREYGPQAMTTITKNIQPGKFWTSQPVDSQEKQEMQRQLDELRDGWESMRTENSALREKMRDFDDQRTQIDEKIETLKSEKSTLQKEFQRWQSLPDKIESEDSAKVAHEQALREARNNIVEIRYSWDEAVVKRATLTLRHKKAIDDVREAHQALLEARIRLIKARSDILGLKERNSAIVERLEAEEQALHQATEEVDKTLRIGTALGNQLRSILVDAAQRDHLSTLAAGKSPIEMEMEISAEEAKLELIHIANPSVVQEFEKRAQHIAKLAKRVEGSEEVLNALNRQIETLMGKWEPRLEELISEISDAFAYNFEQINCAGEVRIRKDENFDAWSLGIMVRFRENESLQQLTSHRQSGGERAVATIFYLMALQSLAQAPFRVVDEINQGMDPRNERMMHERMVEIASRERTSQYFLITPKLLTGLGYDDKMRVLCIASGEYMPENGTKLDFRRCLAIQKSLMSAG